MGTSSCLRVRDVRLANQIVNECRELWADAAAWRQHLVMGASRLTGLAVAHYSEFVLRGQGGKPRAFCHADVGWRDETARDAFRRASAAHPNQLKFFLGSERFMPRLAAGRAFVALREEMCPDDVWYRSCVYNEFRRYAHDDDNVLSVIPHADELLAVFDVSQDVAEPRPTLRTKRQLALLHRMIDPLVGTELSTERQRGIYGLSPQLRATLSRLLEGDSEKQIATRLGLRRATVHEYVGKIYRHFGTRSRAELMTYFIRRRPKPK